MDNTQKLNDIIRYAYNNVQYYKNLFDNVNINPNINDVNLYFKEIPLLNKDIVLKNTELFLSEEFDKKNLISDRTSGSTGKILNVYWNKEDHIRSLISLWSKRKILHNILPNSKSCYFHSIAYRSNQDDDDNKHVFSPRIFIRDHGTIMSFSKLDFSDIMLEKYYNSMVEFQPEWIMCHPSTLYLFAQYMEKKGLNTIKSLRYIELTGELLNNIHRNKIEEVFNVATTNEYGAREVNGIAYECECGNLHCLSQNVYVEIISDGKNVGYNKSGNICITGLNNRAMPFIRYDLGDHGKIIEGDSCQCGDKNPILIVEKGRSNEVIKFKNGSYVECVVFFYVIEYINSQLENCIMQFQIIQKDEHNFEVILALRMNYGNDDITNIKKFFVNQISQYGFSESQWSFQFINQIIPDYNSGKLNYFINKSQN